MRMILAAVNVNSENGTFLLGVGVTALVVSAVGIRVQFRAERLLATARSRLWYVTLVLVSAGVPVAVAAFRPVLGATVGLAAPLPVWLRPSPSRGEGRELSATRSTTARIGEALNILALELENELWEAKRAFCDGTILRLQSDPDACANLHGELVARHTSHLLPGTAAFRKGALRAAFDRWTKSGRADDLVYLAYEWRQYVLIERYGLPR